MSVASRHDWRLIEDPPADGFRNMGVDEALLESCADGSPDFPVLRFYSFSPACLSLGFSQEFARAADPVRCRAFGTDVVRRPTGGRAVLHDDEITYAIIARRAEPPFDASLLDVYRAVSRGLILGLSRLGIASRVADRPRSTGSPREGAVCFAEASRHELVAEGAKVVGSSQARRRGAFLQHGSIPLRFDRERLAIATGTAGNPAAIPDIPGLRGLPGGDVPVEKIVAALEDGFQEAFGITLRRGAISRGEAERAEWLRAHRYLTSAWTCRR